jgi:hypothetical protein
MSSIEKSIQLLRNDALTLFLACVNYNIKYTDFKYDKASSPITIKEEMFKFILEYDANAFRIIRLVGLVLFTTFDSNRDHFTANGILNHDQLLEKFISDLMYHPEVQNFLDIQYKIYFES